MSAEDAVKQQKINVYLKEYDSLRAEIFNRLSAQGQAFSFFSTIIGVLIGLKAAAGGTAGEKALLLDLLILGLPLIAAPFGFIFFDNEIMIFRNGSYINEVLRPKLESLLGDGELLCCDSKNFQYLGDFTKRTHTQISYGRWSLFLLPTAVLIIYWIDSGLFSRLKGPLPQVILLVDLVYALLMIIAMIAAKNAQKKWKGDFRLELPE